MDKQKIVNEVGASEVRENVRVDTEKIVNEVEASELSEKDEETRETILFQGNQTQGIFHSPHREGERAVTHELVNLHGVELKNTDLRLPMDGGQDMNEETLDNTKMGSPGKAWHPQYNPSPRIISRDPPDISGAIFLCSDSRFSECINKKLFGAPRRLFCKFVQAIHIGLPLFLFNIHKRIMFGIFEAASKGQLNIDPGAWKEDTRSQTTRYSAQVRVELVSTTLLFLSESEVREAIMDDDQDIRGESSTARRNFPAEGLLTGEQTSKLQNLFSLRSAGAPSKTTSTMKEAGSDNTSGMRVINRGISVQEKSDSSARKSSRKTHGVNSTGGLNTSIRASTDLSFLREPWRTEAIGAAEYESKERKRLSLPGPVEKLADPGLHQKLLQFKRSPRVVDVESKGDHVQLAEMVYDCALPSVIVRPLESVAKESHGGELNILQEQSRFNPCGSPTSVEYTHNKTVIHHLEAFANHIEQMSTLLIHLQDSSKQITSLARQLERVHSAMSTTLQKSLVSITAELGILKRDVVVLHQQMGEMKQPWSI